MNFLFKKCSTYRIKCYFCSVNDKTKIDKTNKTTKRKDKKMKQAPFFRTMKALADDFFAEAGKFIEQQKAKQNDIH